LTKLIAALLLALNLTTPTLSMNKEEFTARFEKGAVFGCVVFQQQMVGEPDVNFPDGRYTPRKCYYLDPTDVEFRSDWDFIERYNTPWLVWAEMHYGEEDQTILSNQIAVTR